ncbi:hypothetical protein RI367_004818 [Sorochytrium milnesiophthora]
MALRSSRSPQQQQQQQQATYARDDDSDELLRGDTPINDDEEYELEQPEQPQMRQPHHNIEEDVDLDENEKLLELRKMVQLHENDTSPDDARAELARHALHTYASVIAHDRSCSIKDVMDALPNDPDIRLDETSLAEGLRMEARIRARLAARDEEMQEDADRVRGVAKDVEAIVREETWRARTKST